VIQHLQLENFSVFKKASIEFSPKINVIVGENGTGKTHLLKTAYALCSWRCLAANGDKKSKSELSKSFTEKLLRVFFPGEHDLKELVNRNSDEQASLSIAFADGHSSVFRFKHRSKSALLEASPKIFHSCSKPILFPAKEILSFLPGIMQTGDSSQTIQSLFDDSYLDLCPQLFERGQHIDIDHHPRVGTLLRNIADKIGGEFRLKESRLRFVPGVYAEKPGKRNVELAAFASKELEDGDSPSLPQLGDDIDTVFVPSSSGERPGHTMAEGFKKLGVLQQLLLNGSLVPGKSGTLFWDEPEANLNPQLMRFVVEVLLELSRNGQQVVIATHDYVTLKWLDLLASPKKMQDHVRYFTLLSSKDGMQVQSADSYSEMGKNAIAQTFSDLYEGEISRALGDAP
jgi:energy-coupling factor transporter ATP-binding protein EcfA2